MRKSLHIRVFMLYNIQAFLTEEFDSFFGGWLAVVFEICNIYRKIFMGLLKQRRQLPGQSLLKVIT